MQDVSDIIAAFGGASEFARAIGLRGPSTASEMARNRSISGRYWFDIVTVAQRRGIKGITYQALAKMHRGTRVA